MSLSILLGLGAHPIPLSGARIRALWLHRCGNREVTMNYISRSIFRVLLVQNLILLLWSIRFITILFLSGINGVAETNWSINLISGYNSSSLINVVVEIWLMSWRRLKMDLIDSTPEYILCSAYSNYKLLTIMIFIYRYAVHNEIRNNRDI